jgi:hypothetical protein
MTGRFDKIAWPVVAVVMGPFLIVALALGIAWLVHPWHRKPVLVCASEHEMVRSNWYCTPSQVHRREWELTHPDDVYDPRCDTPARYQAMSEGADCS